MEYMKKLIEVALPLEAINRESAREKSIRHGHPSTLHLWWSRKPLATARAVLFASLVDDPSSHPELFPTDKEQEEERQRLFRIIERLVIWENPHNEQVLTEARAEIMNSTGGNPPAVLDPFCGGGSILLEAQRLGLKAFGSDLNPVAVLVTKALVEIPPKFSGMPPVNPKVRAELNATIGWKGAKGLAEDVRYYGQWMREEALKRIAHLYPTVRLPKEQGNGQAAVIAWLWARTVKCPNPACGCEMPLTSKWWLSKKKGKEAWVEPVIKESRIEYEVRYGKGPVPEGTVNRKGAKCICCGAPANFDYIRAEGKVGRMKAEMLAVVAEGLNGRVYLSVVEEQVKSAHVPKPEYFPDAELPTNPRDFKTPNYGMTRFSDLFTNRQLTALATFSQLVGKAREKIKNDALSTGINIDKAQEYAKAVSVYLAFAVDKLADRCSTICSWDVTRDGIRNTFARQAIPMVWDFAEVNPFSNSSGNFLNCLEWCEKYLRYANPKALGFVRQKNAIEGFALDEDVVVSTDPPYYDNIGYADLSDFFYIWLRQSLKQVYPELFSTVLVPKAAELIATPYRFDGDKQKAKEFFEDGFPIVMYLKHLRECLTMNSSSSDGPRPC